MYKISDKITAFIDPVRIESQALQQIETLAKMPFIHQHIAVMPDCHAGKGSCVGTVIATRGALIPSCCGVDLGCGMVGVKTNLTSKDLPDNLEALRVSIERQIAIHSHRKKSDSALNRSKQLIDKFDKDESYFNRFNDWSSQIGTLGGGEMSATPISNNR